MSSTEESVQFDALLDFLKRHRGFDFTGYKRATLERRVQKRLEAVGLDGYDTYLDLLERDPSEFTQLFNTLLINVTRFFRDEAPWTALATDVLPALIARRGDASPIRVWSAGCASGEEPYSLAMLLAEALGPERFRERVKIYATDVDDEALAAARSAIYTEKQVEDVPSALRDRHFESLNGRFVVTKELRRSVIFGRNDLVQDAPISRIDLLVCRNTLMYFNSDTQDAVLSRFHFALAEHGVLLLGRAETLLTQSSAFVPIDLKQRIFGKATRLGARERILVAPPPALRDGADVSKQRLRDAAFEAGGEPRIVVDRRGDLALANAAARKLFSLTAADVGRPLRDLEITHRPVADLGRFIEESVAGRRPVIVPGVRWRPNAVSTDRWVNVEITPMVEGGGTVLGVGIVFADVTTAKSLQLELEESRRSLQTAYEELQSTNEELETTNEELQSTVEELETTNEELQSTNEELETMNEELQSANVELQSMNDELVRRGDELNDLNAFLESLLASVSSGVIVIDRDYRVLVWNPRSEEMWGVSSAQAIDRNVLSLDIGLPLESVTDALRAILSGRSNSAEVTVSAVNRGGRALQCVVSCSPLVSVGRAVRGAIIMMREAD